MDVIDSLSDFELEFQKVVAYPEGSDAMNEPTKRFIKSKKFPSIAQVSQNCSVESRKTRGQDCASVSFHKGYHCIVVCDGHDEDGLFVASEICFSLPKIIFKMMEELKEGDSIDIIPEDIFLKAFVLAEINSCFSKGLKPNHGEKCFLPGTSMVDFKICEFLDFSNDDKTECLLRVINTTTNEHREVDEKISAKFGDVWGPKYAGGCTCSCSIFHEKSRTLRVAILGDSRVAVLPPVESGLNRESLVLFKKKNLVGPSSILRPVRPVNPFDEVSEFPSDDEKENADHDNENDEIQSKSKGKIKEIKKSSSSNSVETFETVLDSQTCLISDAHQLTNEKELQRITTAFKGKHVLQESEPGSKYLCHPESGDTIEPTRGFGDLDMLGTGYCFTPELSEEIKLPRGTILCMASDGVFDQDIWKEGEFAFFVARLREESGFNEDLDLNKARRSLKAFAQDLFAETVTRATEIYEPAQVDDISLVCSVVL